MLEPGFKEQVIRSVKISVANKPVVTKLYQPGMIPSINDSLTDKTIKDKIREAKVMFNLAADGIVRSNLLSALNIPVQTRIEQLSLSLNYYRWINHLL
jgi:murein L,D-transpeptidase YcbB/YkuD